MALKRYLFDHPQYFMLPAKLLFRRSFGSVRTFVLFSGYPRSGHSLVGALIDAHPDAVVAHELDLLRYIDGGLDRQQDAFALIIARSKLFRLLGNSWTGYDYTLRGSWQNGRFQRLLVIGDKKGGVTSKRLASDYGLLERLRAVVGVSVRVVHIVRNPFDNLATRLLRHTRGSPPTDEQLAEWVEKLAAGLRVNQRLIDDPGVEVLTQKIEDYIGEPRTEIRRLLRFLELRLLPDHVEACAERINSNVSRTRDRIEWSPESLREIARLIERYPFLHGYSFDA